MSLSSETMMKLMAYADGELEGEELEEAQRLIATDADSFRFVEQIAGLGEIVSEGYDAAAGVTVAKVDVADAVMARVASGATASKESKPAKVSSLGEARLGEARLGEARKKRSGVGFGAGVAAALALAASIAVFARHRTDETPMAAGPTVTAAPVAQVNPAAAAAAVTAPASGAGVDVSTVNSPGNSVSVFYLPTANELSTSVVVWVDETGEK